MKKTTWFALICTAVYAVIQVVELVSHLEFRLPATLIVFVSPLVSPVLVALHILCGKKGGKGINVLFAVAMGWLLLGNLQSLRSPLQLAVQYPEVWSLWMTVAVDVAMAIGTVLMFVGSLQGFRRAALLQIGAWVNAALTAAYVAVAFIGAQIVSYFERVPESVPAVNWVVFCGFMATALFYAGLGVLAVEKKREKALDFSAQE